MALTPKQQAQEAILRASRILILTKERPDHDALAAAVAFSLFLKKIKKDADITAPGVQATEIPSFLPSRDSIRETVGAMRAFHLTLNLKQTPLAEFMYDVKDGKLDVTVVPKSGEWSTNDAAFSHGQDRYDLVITLGCPDMASLGVVAREHADFLYRTTILNIDCDATNEHWGQINLVDLNAVAISEVLYGLIEEWNRNAIDEPIATSMLTGMICRTKSFRTKNVTPKTLSIASQLVAMGAKREEIVHGLWRTRSVPTLKLWGRALARLEQDRELGLVWTILSQKDFLETGVGAESLDGVVSELLSYAPEARVIALITEQDHGHQPMVTLHVQPPLSAAEIVRPFSGTGTRDRATVELPAGASLVERTRTFIDRLRETLRATHR